MLLFYFSFDQFNATMVSIRDSLPNHKNIWMVVEEYFVVLNWQFYCTALKPECFSNNMVATDLHGHLKKKCCYYTVQPACPQFASGNSWDTAPTTPSLFFCICSLTEDDESSLSGISLSFGWSWGAYCTSNTGLLSRVSHESIKGHQPSIFLSPACMLGLLPGEETNTSQDPLYVLTKVSFKNEPLPVCSLAMSPCC